MQLPETLNFEYIDDQYLRWKKDPGSVPRDWDLFFKGFELAGSRGPAADGEGVSSEAVCQNNVDALVHRYRDLGHLLACMDPLAACPVSHPFLDLAAFGLGADDLDSEFATGGLAGMPQAPLRDIVQTLRETYCHSIGVEYMHLQDPDERKWLQQRMEPTRNRAQLTDAQRLRILERLDRSALFESFINKKYVGVTRFSLEGGDSLIPLLDALGHRAADAGCREMIVGMAHRGRLNVLTHFLGKPYIEIFSEFESCYDPAMLTGAGDVKYHNGHLSDIAFGGHAPMRIYLASNPSHLEAVDPVVQGIARARQDLLGTDGLKQVVPLIMHGDAAFAGQGVVTETLNMSQLLGYRTGGTVHIIVNNQIGYTTLPEDARSTRYSTDVAKMLMVPIFHVHGEDPEAVVHAAQLAFDYRMAFGKDVVIDLVCYRRYGHNEGDEPYFTQPTMYTRIRQRPPVNRVYEQQLADAPFVDAERLKQQRDAIVAELEADYNEVHGSSCLFPQQLFYSIWDQYGSDPKSGVKTAVDAKTLHLLSRRLTRLPENFKPNNKLKKLLDRRAQAVASGKGIDWANAEHLAFGSLLMEGTPIRLSGQDCSRGTFSQRHAVVFDAENGSAYQPLNHIDDSQAEFQVYNSLLAEYGVVGFEYGYAQVRPECLTIWEAQFGDFANTAQAIIDLFIAAGETKWQRACGLVLLLPHGWEGLGPEHSSARLERFLQLCAEDNMRVCNLTTPAQYFHLLRRQMVSRVRKPLVLMAPKSLLRHPAAVSTLDDLAKGGFNEVLDDPARLRNVKKVIFCSGKIYYELLARRQALKLRNVAILRIEQLYPFPEKRIRTITGKLAKARQWLWVQEDPKNMGAWQYVSARLAAVIGKHLQYIGRPAAASPATGFPKIYRQQQDQIIDDALGPILDESVDVG